MDRECNIKDGFEIRQALSRLAMLHSQLRAVEFKEEWSMGSNLCAPLEEELERHNKEMRVPATISGEAVKSPILSCVSLETTICFTSRPRKPCRESKGCGRRKMIQPLNIDALEAAEIREIAAKRQQHGPGGADDRAGKPVYLCHGDLDQHHVLMGNGYTAIIEYNRMHLGIQVSDLYRFMRKVMEKHGWNMDLGAVHAGLL